MTTQNPLAYINNLRGAGAGLRATVDAAADIQRRISLLQSELASLEASTATQVAQHWTLEEVACAKSEAPE